MRQFKRILCYVGGSSDPQPGLTEATDLAARNNAELTLLDVLPESTGGLLLSQPEKPDLESLIMASHVHDLEALAAPITARGIQVRSEVCLGSPFIEIIRRVLEASHDLVIKTGQGKEAGRGGLLGTTASLLMRKCPAPVWVVKPFLSPRFDRVLAAVDPDLETPGAQKLAARVLKHAISLAESRDSKLHVVHAWWLYAEASLTGPRFNMSPAEVEPLLRDTRETAQRALDSLIEGADLSSVPHEIQLAKGIPSEVISHLAQQSDVAVMGTLSRSGIKGMLIGNTAETVLRHIECSVLAIKPHGFKTPLSF